MKKTVLRKDEGVDRREFLKYSAVLGGAVAIGGLSFQTAMAADLRRMEAGGKYRVLGCNPHTSTDGYWDNSTKHVMEINSGDVVEVETGTHLIGQMVPGADINDWMKWYKEVQDKTQETYFYPDPLTGAEKLKRGGHHHLTGPIYVNGGRAWRCPPDRDPGDHSLRLRLQPESRGIFRKTGAAR